MEKVFNKGQLKFVFGVLSQDYTDHADVNEICLFGLANWLNNRVLWFVDKSGYTGANVCLEGGNLLCFGFLDCKFMYICFSFPPLNLGVL